VTETHEWLWGWDPTPGIVSVWANNGGEATVWRRIPETGLLVSESERFRPWLLLDRIDDLAHMGSRLAPDGAAGALITYRELEGRGELRYVVSAADFKILTSAVLEGASRRLGRRVGHIGDLEDDAVLALPPDEQYLVATGRTYFRGLSFDSLHRMQFDLETTGLNPERDRVFMISIRYPNGDTEVLEARKRSDAAEAELLRELMARVASADPDVIENHNLHGFDLPFIDHRARKFGVPIVLGRTGQAGLRQRAAQRGMQASGGGRRRVRFIAPGRELIDTMDAVIRYDFSTRALPGHGLKAVAKYLGFASPDREYIKGSEIYSTYRTDPDRVRRYATDDVIEVSHLSRMLGGAAFALAQMAPRRYERLADAGAATGVIDPLLVRAYIRSGTALPKHKEDDGTPHSGATLRLYAAGVARRVVKVDVASLYPSLMRQYRIGPSRDTLGALLALVDGLVERRLKAKSDARLELPGSAERHTHEALSAAMKIVVNSAYGYLAAGGSLTRFADVHAANEVTRRGRETLETICSALADRGVTLLEADTDGVYFAVPDAWTEADERRVVDEVAALLPPLVQLELEGRYAAMLSHEPKNYALLGYDGSLVLRGVAFRSRRAEPFAETFLKRAVTRLLSGDVAGMRDVFVATIEAVRRRAYSTREMSSRVRLTKSPERYLASRDRRRELPYEAVLMSGRTEWRVGERIRVYRKQNGEAGLVNADDDDGDVVRDYDVEHYVRQLRETYASRLARAFRPDDFNELVSDPDQLTLLPPSFDKMKPVLNRVAV
jgi:DNA polymerase elongation subunit (family B)